MKKILPFILIVFVMISCDISHKPYLKHHVTMEKLSERCLGKSDAFSMNSNINGERYVFQECLSADTDAEDVVIQRNGDTVSIQFSEKSATKKLFGFTIDINTQPRYNWLTIGNQTMAIIPSSN
jgi:hypothetical protein